MVHHKQTFVSLVSQGKRIVLNKTCVTSMCILISVRNLQSSLLKGLLKSVVSRTKQHLARRPGQTTTVSTQTTTVKTILTFTPLTFRLSLLA